jgi:hypothetical protein
VLEDVQGFIGGVEEHLGPGIVDPDDHLYRPVNGDSDGSGISDDLRLNKHRRLARLQYFRSAIGGALPDTLVARVVGAGVQWKAKKPELQDEVNRFVEDPYNDLAGNLRLYATEALVFGELAFPLYLTPENADVRMGYLAPDQIEAVIWKAGDQKRALAFIQRKGIGSEFRRLWIIPQEQPDPDPKNGNLYPPHPGLHHGDAEKDLPEGTVLGLDGLPVELPKDPRTGRVLPEIAALLDPAAGGTTLKVAGYAFYHRFNTLVCGRGRTIYERVFDYLKAADDFLFGTLRGLILSGYVLFHLMLKGKKPTDIQKRREELSKNPPRPGSFFVTDETEEFKPISSSTPPGIILREALGGALKVIGLGAGLPGHELGAEDDTNRSTAQESRSVSINRAKMFQQALEAMVTSWIRYALAQKVHGGSITATGPDLRVEGVFPELDARDEAEIAETVQKATAAMISAVEARLVLRRDARSFLYQSMGIDLPSEADFKKALADQDQEDDVAFYGRSGRGEEEEDPDRDPDADAEEDDDPGEVPPPRRGGGARGRR